MKTTIYSTSSCAACAQLTKWLESKDISYEKKITDEDPEVMNEFMSVNDGMIGVPFTVIEDESGEVTKISGFEKSKFESALGLR